MFALDTTSAITPAETFAIVGGVESHAAGPAWDLDGPAVDAARFARWLHGRGVPVANIVLLVSPLEKNRDLAWPGGCSPEPAAREKLIPLLHNTLRTRHERLLIFFWGGHGIVHGGETRRLFFTEAEKHNRANLDLNGMLGLLRGNQWPPEAWPKQIIMADACANLAEREGWTEKLPGETYSAGEPLTSREQFVLLAARPGEYAANLKQTGLFSRELLTDLEQRPAGEWPPDMEVITKKLVARFESLREQGFARQTPTYFWSRDWRTNERTLGGFLPSAQTGLPTSAPGALLFRDKTDLRDALLACPSLRGEHSRDDLRLNLRPAIANSVNYSRNASAQTLNLLETCLRYPGGIGELFEVVRGTDWPDPAVDQLEQTIRRLLPRELLPPASL